MTLLAIIRDTLRQAASQIIVFVLLGFAVITIVLAAVGLSCDEDTGKVYLLGSEVEQEEEVREILRDEEGRRLLAYNVRSGIVYIMFFLGPILFIFASSFLTTRNMRKGIVDLYVSKPVSRFGIMLGRIISVFLVYFIPLAISIIGASIVVGAKLDVGVIPFGAMLGISAVMALLFTALSAGLGALTKSPVLALLLLSVMWFTSPAMNLVAGLWKDTSVYGVVDDQEEEAQRVNAFAEKPQMPEKGTFLHYLARGTLIIREYIWLPHGDLHDIAVYSVSQNQFKILTWRPLWVALAQIVLGLGVAFVSFGRRNF